MDFQNLSISEGVKDGVKVGFGAIMVGFFLMISRLYRVWKTGQALERKYEHVTDETIRKELWTQWAIMKEALTDREKENKSLSVNLERVKGMHANCLEMSGTQTHEINQLKERISQLEEEKNDA